MLEKGISIKNFIDVTIELQNIIYSLECEEQIQPIADEIARSNFMKLNYQFKMNNLITNIFKAYETRFKMQNAFPKLVIALADLYQNQILEIRRSIYKICDRIYEKEVFMAINYEINNIDTSLSFIRRLFDLGFLQVEKLMNRVIHMIKINKDDYIRLHIMFWFGKELKEYDNTKFEEISSDLNCTIYQTFLEERLELNFNIVFNGNANKYYYQLPESLEKVIYDDNIQEFIQIFSSNNLEIDENVELYDFFPFSPKYNLRHSSNKPINIAAYYGSNNIFKFLFVQPGIRIDKELLEDAISGGSVEIVHLLEQKIRIDLLFLNARFHHNDICNWLLETKSAIFDTCSLIINDNIELIKKVRNTDDFSLRYCIKSNSFACALYFLGPKVSLDDFYQVILLDKK